MRAVYFARALAGGSRAGIALCGRAFSLVVLIVGATPLVVSQPAPFVDWPNHLSRVFIAVSLLRGEMFWREFYKLNTQLVPNEALDLGIGLLHYAGLSIDFAGLLFLLITYAVFVSGFLRLARTLGVTDAGKPALAALLFCTGPLMYGLVNYVLGIGLALWLHAAWRTADPARRWILAVLGTLALFYVHLLAAAIWVLFAVCVEFPASFAARRSLTAFVRAGSSFGAAAVFLIAFGASPVMQNSLPHADGSNIFYMGQPSLLMIARWKAAVFVRLFTDHAGTRLAIGTWIALAALAICAGVGARLRIRGTYAAALAVLLVCVVVLPESAGDGSLLDYRIVLPATVFAAAAMQVRWRSRLAARIAFAVLIGLVTARAAAFAGTFSREAQVFRAADAVIGTLPPGSIMLTARGRPDDEIPVAEWWAPPMEHVSTRAVLRDILVPTVFADASQHSIVLNPVLGKWRNEWRISNGPEWESFQADIEPLCRAASAQARAIYLFLAYPGAAANVVNPDAVIVATPAFRIYDACHLGVAPRFAAAE